MKKLLFVIPAVFCLFACSNGLGWKDAASGAKRIDKSKRTAIDDTRYVDFTIPANDAKQVAKNGFLAECSGRFVNGTSAITLDIVKGTVSMSSDHAFIDGREGRQFYAKYSFDVDGAGSNCLCISGIKTKPRGRQLLTGNRLTPLPFRTCLSAFRFTGTAPDGLK